MKFLNLLKAPVFFTIFAGIFYILEYGFIFDSKDKFISPVLLSIVTVLMIFKPGFKIQAVIWVVISLFITILADFFGIKSVSEIISEFSFSLLVVIIILYLPQIIRKGHIEKF